MQHLEPRRLSYEITTEKTTTVETENAGVIAESTSEITTRNVVESTASTIDSLMAKPSIVTSFQSVTD